MEVKAFRVACGDFVSESDVDKGLLEKPGTAVAPHGVVYAEGMFAARGLALRCYPGFPMGRGYFFIPMSSGRGRIVMCWQRTKAQSVATAIL